MILLQPLLSLLKLSVVPESERSPNQEQTERLGEMGSTRWLVRSEPPQKEHGEVRESHLPLVGTALPYGAALLVGRARGGTMTLFGFQTRTGRPIESWERNFVVTTLT